MKSRSCVIGCYNNRSALKFDRHLGSAAAEVPVKFQSDWKSLNPNLAASRLYEILSQQHLPFITLRESPWTAALNFLTQLTSLFRPMLIYGFNEQECRITSPTSFVWYTQQFWHKYAAFTQLSVNPSMMCIHQHWPVSSQKIGVSLCSGNFRDHDVLIWNHLNPPYVYTWTQYDFKLCTDEAHPSTENTLCT